MIRVLVVDDDFMVAKVHGAFVGRTPGFEVAGVAHTGAAALHAAEELQPDLVLLDIHLPDLSGSEVTVAVSDSGPGVADAVRESLFERGVTTKQEELGGRGIGLSLVHLVCSRRGGAVEVEHGTATRFVARLPHAPAVVS